MKKNRRSLDSRTDLANYELRRLRSLYPDFERILGVAREWEAIQRLAKPMLTSIEATKHLTSSVSATANDFRSFTAMRAAFEIGPAMSAFQAQVPTSSWIPTINADMLARAEAFRPHIDFIS